MTDLTGPRFEPQIFSKGAVFPGCNDAEMGPANSLHASAYYSGCNRRFNLSPGRTSEKMPG